MRAYIFQNFSLGVLVGGFLKRKIKKVLYSISSGSRETITASYMVSASGLMVPPRCVFKGVRNVAQERLKHLPKDGKSGK